MSIVPEDVREQLNAAIDRNSYLLSLLPIEFGEPFSDQLADMEMVASEIRANLGRMKAIIGDAGDASPSGGEHRSTR